VNFCSVRMQYSTVTQCQGTGSNFSVVAVATMNSVRFLVGGPERALLVRINAATTLEGRGKVFFIH
jgi:hypothetical protein